MRPNASTPVATIEVPLVRFLARYSVPFLRLSMGVIFLWFGTMKFFPGASPAEDLALRTIEVMTAGGIPLSLARVLLASLECVIGVGFLIGRFLRPTLLTFAFQMVGTLSPLVLFPNEIFGPSPLTLSLEGQYMIKNVVLIGAGLVLGATLHGGRIVSHSPQSTLQSTPSHPDPLVR